ncbi:MAG: rhodanese-like domain-containing protein [Leptospirillia bacterium]
MSTSRNGSSRSDSSPEDRAREFGRLLGDKGKRLSCRNMKEILSERRRGSGSKPPLLLDVREGWEHRYVRFPGSLHISLSRLPESLDQIPRDRPIIVYCHTGIRSLLACYLLLENGYPDVANLEGGIDRWASEIDPRIPRYSLEPGRRPPAAVLDENRKGESRPIHNPWGEEVDPAISSSPEDPEDCLKN